MNHFPAGGVCLQVLCHSGGRDGLQSHVDEEEGEQNCADIAQIVVKCQNPLFYQVKQKKIVVKKIEWLEVSSHLAKWKSAQCKKKLPKKETKSIDSVLLYCKNESDCCNLDYTENGGIFWGVRLWSDWRNICLVQFWSFLRGTPPISLPDATWPFWGLLTDSQSLLFAKTSYNSFPSWLAQMLKLIQPTYICKYEERKNG